MNCSELEESGRLFNEFNKFCEDFIKDYKKTHYDSEADCLYDEAVAQEINL